MFTASVVLYFQTMSGLTREIVTFQLGHYANFVGSHWWNIQVNKKIYLVNIEAWNTSWISCTIRGILHRTWVQNVNILFDVKLY